MDNFEVTITIPKKRPFKNIYQFKITLLETNPPVWRRIAIPESYTFYDLHVAVQDAMGWQDCHLHSFETRTKGFGRRSNIVRVISPAEEPEFDEPLPLYSTEISIKQYFKNENDSMMYVYDFGDDWEHEVILEKICPKEKGISYPICLDGKLSCPPEDCGSFSGYYKCIDALNNQNNEEGLLDWLGDWKPDNFVPKNVVFEKPKRRFEKAFGD